ncbi:MULTISPECIES: L-fucose:H+ symporter permease [Olivibacter]|uniref:L-fucose:H+ symporter permease n=1 Tax=Olivibacter jilunii TaxID=985016 RepID=A0ABW6B5P4_9SPHI|nr:L-fucose:H+ symporter permease [Olivibacter sp. UJ_SKK_5.1]MDX3915906.1 L-fucose:H+ symporter permease [Pseudosphingobacterium sp.]
MEILVNESLAQSKTGQSAKKYLLPFILVTGLFFLWGMAHNLDSILIPHLKKACNLTNSQSALVDTSVFFAYFIMAIPSGFLLKRFGYKHCIIIGLLVFAGGAYLFVPAANNLSYEIFLLALFIIGCGLAILETTANPYAAVLGSPATAGRRLNLAASFNGLAAMVAPIVGANFILSGKEYSKDALAAMQETERLHYFMDEASSVKLPYVILGTVLLLVAIAFLFVKLPEVGQQPEHVENSNFFSVWKYRNLSFGVVAQFFYVGAQVCITSFFIRMAQQGANVDEKTAGYYLGIYGFLFMLGRFVGTFLLRFLSSRKLLILFTAFALLLCLAAILGEGMSVVYALGSIGFFMSIMFPTIFALGIEGLGDQTKAASSWLIMSIVGGAILPYGMGSLIDYAGDSIQIGYIVPLVCFVVVLAYGWRGGGVSDE